MIVLRTRRSIGCARGCKHSLAVEQFEACEAEKLGLEPEGAIDAESLTPRRLASTWPRWHTLDGQDLRTIDRDAD
jgi:hypothetical protein